MAEDPELDDLDRAIDALVARSVAPDRVPDGDLAAGLGQLSVQSIRAEAARTFTVGEWDARCLHAHDGSRSPAARLSRDSGCSAASARLVVRRARRLRSMPVTAQAFAAGDLHQDKVDALCLANADGREALFAEAEHRLVSDAKRLRHEDLNRVIRYWIDAADDLIGASSRADRDRAGRNFHASRSLGGNVELGGRLDPVAGTVFLNELERIEHGLFRAEWEAAREIWGEALTVDRLERTPERRRADALVIMAERSAAAAPDGVPARPLLTVHVDQDALHQAATGRARGAADGAPTSPGSTPGDDQAGRTQTAADDPAAAAAPGGPVPTVDRAPAGNRPPWAPATGRICELDDGTVLTPDHLTPWLSDADVERAVWGPGSRITDLGRRSRLFRGGARRVIELRDRHCVHPGCLTPSPRCDVDHVTEWSRGGGTDQDNGRLLCGPHNRRRPGRDEPPGGDPPWPDRAHDAA